MAELISVSEIRQDPSTQPRLKMNMDVIEDYSDSMKNGGKFPALVLFKVDGSYILVDGYHRLWAAQAAKIKKILCDVHEGTMRDAILYSLGVNATHGLRRTNDDKKRAVERLLVDPEWSQWSDRQIADTCHVSHTFVGKCRGVTVNIASEDSAEAPKTRIFATKHGTVSRMRTENIGKKPVSGLGPTEKGHPNHGVGCAQPGSLPAETDLPVQPSYAEQLKNEPHGSSAFHTASAELAAKKGGIAGEMFPDHIVDANKMVLPCRDGKPCPDPANRNHLIVQQVLGNKCKISGSLTKDMKECPLQKRTQAAQAGGFVPEQGRPITDERRPLIITAVKKTDAEAEDLMVAAVRGNWTDKEQQAADRVINRLLDEGEITAKSHNEAYRALVLRACEGME